MTFKVAVKIIVFNLCLVSLICYVSSEMEGFIIGGDYTNITKHPHSAFLLVNCHTEYNESFGVCGSSIINQVILVTAGHCLDTCGQNTKVWAGIGYTNKMQGLTHSAINFKVHELFDLRSLSNDIALVRLSERLQFGPNVKRVSLLKRSFHVDGVLLAGWGIINKETKADTVNLKEAKQKIWPRSKCISLWKRMANGTICAVSDYPSGTKKIGHGAHGDSGSGLIAKGYILVGIVSYGNLRYTESVVYTDPVYHYDWIWKTAAKLYCDNDRK